MNGYGFVRISNSVFSGISPAFTIVLSISYVECYRSSKKYFIFDNNTFDPAP